MQELKTWASKLIYDPVNNVYQRRDIKDIEWEEGFTGNVSSQLLNSFFHLASTHALCSVGTPQLYPSNKTLPSVAWEMDGRTFTEVEAPNLYELYDGVLPDKRSEAITGFTYIVRVS